MEYLIRSAVGVLLGILCRIPCDRLERYLTEKRGLPYERNRKADTVVFVFMELLGAWILCENPTIWGAVYAFCLMGLAEVTAMMDLRHRIIPNGLVLALLGLRLAFGIPALLGAADFPAFRPGASLLGLAVGLVVFSLPGLFGKKVGAGDIKLAAAMGFCLGWQGALAAIVLMGLFVLGYSVLQRSMPVLRMLKSTIPMGPFLSAGMIVVFLLTKVPQLAGIIG